ncbi:scaffolding protein [Staphylococcus phage 37]|uniref:ORF023 n=1 Tax=Staphylococcus phage 37 TaxID=2936813 RepID=Q4ZCE9_9CAUD|nr:scaffolding protein [Staphylococcus phage 37]AAX91284.1 ORF023 [Staphylococcus phage 37]
MDLQALLEKFKNGEVDAQKVIDAVDESKSGMIPRSRLNDKTEEIKDLQTEIENRDKQISQLEKSVKDESEIQKELEQVKQQNADWQNKYQQSQLNNAIKLAVAKDANDADDVLALLNKEGLELQDDNTVKGLDDAVNQLREAKPYLFVDNKPTGRTPNDGVSPQGGLTQEQFDNMSVAERTDLFVNDRSTYDKFVSK